MNNAPIYDRNKRKPSTFTVPQQAQPMRNNQPKPTPNAPPQQQKPQQQPKPQMEVDHFLLQARRDEAKVDITLISGKEYCGALIKTVERYMVVIEHDGRDIAIMKTAVASIAR
jgi:sRNA-binding regulator protein Hfq